MKLKLFTDGWRMTYTGCFQDQNKPSMLRPGLWRHLLKSINMWKKKEVWSKMIGVYQQSN